MKNALLLLLPIMVACGDTGGATTGSAGGSTPAKSTKPSASAKASASAAATTSTAPSATTSATAADSASASSSAVASGSASAGAEDDCTKLCALELKCVPEAAEKEKAKAKTDADKKKIDAQIEKIKKDLEPAKCHEMCTAQSKDHAEAAKNAAACATKPDCEAQLKCVAEVNKAEAAKKPAK